MSLKEKAKTLEELQVVDISKLELPKNTLNAKWVRLENAEKEVNHLIELLCKYNNQAVEYEAKKRMGSKMSKTKEVKIRELVFRELQNHEERLKEWKKTWNIIEKEYEGWKELHNLTTELAQSNLEWATYIVKFKLERENK